MSEDEILILGIAAVLSLVAAAQWYLRLRRPSLVVDRSTRAVLAYAPPAGLVAILVVLLTAASYDVRSAPQYIVFYLVLGAAWIFLSSRLFTLFGVSVLDDAIERRNPAATVAAACAMLALTAIYAGANIGDGPGWWCVLVAGGVGAAAWFALWGVVEAACHASEQLTVERDLPAALRLGGFMLGAGLICARGSAGDWTSFEQTLVEFRAAWPALLLTGAAIAVELELRRRPQARADFNTAMLIAAFWIGVAIVAVVFSPPLPQNPIYDQLSSSL